MTIFITTIAHAEIRNLVPDGVLLDASSKDAASYEMNEHQSFFLEKIRSSYDRGRNFPFIEGIFWLFMGVEPLSTCFDEPDTWQCWTIRKYCQFLDHGLDE